LPSDDDQRSLITAGDAVDQKLYDLLSEKFPEADFTLNMVRRFKETFGFVSNARKKAEVEILVHGKVVVHDISAEIKRACESILPAIAETAMEMIAAFDPEFQAKLRENIILAGGGSQIAGIGDYLKEEMSELAPCEITCVDDPLYCGSDGAVALAKDMPEQYWEQL
jgi:rod shape-determining protein MreB